MSSSWSKNEELRQASEEGDVTKVLALISGRANVRAEDNSGKTALHRAAENGHAAVVEPLLANRADVNAKDNEKLNTASALLLLSRRFSPSIRPEKILNTQDFANINDGTNNDRYYHLWAARMLVDTYCSRRQFYIDEARKFKHLSSMCLIFLNAWAISSGEKRGYLRGQGANRLDTKCLSKEGLYKSRKIASKTVNTIYHRLKDTINVVHCFDEFIGKKHQRRLRETIQKAIDENIPNLMTFSKNSPNIFKMT